MVFEDAQVISMHKFSKPQGRLIISHLRQVKRITATCPSLSTYHNMELQRLHAHRIHHTSSVLSNVEHTLSKLLLLFCSEILRVQSGVHPPPQSHPFPIKCRRPGEKGISYPLLSHDHVMSMRDRNREVAKVISYKEHHQPFSPFTSMERTLYSFPGFRKNISLG